MIIVYIMVIWFSILLFSNKKYFICSVIILLSSLSNIIIVDVYQLTLPMNYIKELGFLINLDGLTAIILSTLYFKDKLALKMSLLLVFSVICHTMILYDLTIHSSFVSNLFYSWYDELIIAAGLLQMVISKDGISSALRRMRDHLLSISFYWWCFSKHLSVHKESRGRS